MRAFVIRSSDIDRCPIRSFSPEHYRDDGSCLHVPPIDAPIQSAPAVRPIKALSLIQPWASLVTEGIKTVETRGWSTSYRGPLAIAASASIPTDVRHRVLGHRIRGHHNSYGQGDARIQNALYAVGYEDGGVPDGKPLPLGCVVATCRLVECVRTERIQWEPERFEVKGRLVEWSRGGMAADRYDARIAEEQRPFGDYSPGRWAWLLLDVVRLDPPVPVKGRQGLWEWDPSAEGEGRRTALPNAILGG